MKLGRIAASWALVMTACSALAAEPAPAGVSFHKQIRPLLQAHCQGCHQPAKRGGDFVTLTYQDLIRAGESGTPGVVPGKPSESYLLEQITPENGTAQMPKGGKPLAESEVALIRSWIEQGAIDDSPAATTPVIDQAHPPVYSRLPIVTSLAYSPDGTVLAIAGFHEVILRSADGEKLLGRLVGLSERIESVAFSPDGKRLAVAGGLPSRQGELQIWNVEKQELELSIPVVYDTIYGASWSPDGKLVAVGCSDTAVRAFDSKTGEQVFYNSAPDDWALDTVFSLDGSMLVSIGRDMSTKLYHVPTQRFIDNVTSITPGALKGGLSAVVRHPAKDEILVGGSDGVPRIYRMERITKRVIGDDANLMRQFPSMSGRIYSVAYSPDGKLIACGSSLDGRGEVVTYAAEFDSKMPDEIAKIVQVPAAKQTDATRKQLAEYVTSDVKQLTRTEIPSPVYTLAYHPDGKQIAVAGADGKVRIVQPADGEVTAEFPVVDLQTEQLAAANRPVTKWHSSQEKLSGEEQLPGGANVTALEVQPTQVELNGPFDAVQLLVTGVLETGERIDLTRIVELKSASESYQISPLGRLAPRADGSGSIEVQWKDLRVQVPVVVKSVDQPQELNFVRDVNPVLTRVGCNQGTCHGAKDGKNGFKLSLRGYDPLMDLRSFTDDLKSRRTNVAAPENSLILMKASGVVPHVGGQLVVPGEAYYEVLRRWVAEGARLDLEVERVASIEIQPHNPVVQTPGARQQLRVIAHYTNGDSRDVTGEAFLDSGNTEVAEVNRAGVVTAIRRGEAPILARYEGNYAATTLTAMGDRGAFVWTPPETWGEIDELVAAKWERMKIAPSGLCSDYDFIRRVTLDLTGLPPSPAQVLAFAADPRPTRVKRDELIDSLIGSEAFVEFWTNKWADLLLVNSKFLGKQGAAEFRSWIRKNVAENTPYDAFCRSIITATGSNKAHPAASYFKILREPDAIMENTTQLFLGIRFNCNKCHDHPFERWTQDQYYETAAYFAQVGLERDPTISMKDTIGGTAVEGAKPLWEVVFDKTDGEIKHDRTGQVTPPRVPFDRDLPVNSDATRREQLAAWLTSAENDYFSRTYVNRVWGYLLGVGLIEPLDDVRAGNPASNPELLDWLNEEFVQSGFNVRKLMEVICKSRVYQLDVATNEWNADDHLNYSHALPKRLPAEVLYDSVYTVTGAKMKIPGVPAGTRAAALPDVAIALEDGFLANLGRPVRESACECERSSELQLGPVMALMNGATVSQAISQPGNALEQIVQENQDDARMVNEIFLRILNRPARAAEVQATLEMMQQLQQQHEHLVITLKDYEQQIAPTAANKQAAWEEALKKAEQEYQARAEEIRPAREALEKERIDRIAAAQKPVDERLAQLAAGQADWEKENSSGQTAWTAQKFASVESTGGGKLVQGKDLTFSAGEISNSTEFRLMGASGVKRVTGLKLDVLTDPSLPMGGPGRSENGQFVLTEIALYRISGEGAEPVNVPLTNAQASYSGKNFPVSAAIDQSFSDELRGWSLWKKAGESHYATFDLVEPLMLKKGEKLQVVLAHNYKERAHNLGKFRVSFTSDDAPVNKGLPADVAAALAVSPEKKSDVQKQILTDYVKSQDAKLQELLAALQVAEKPLEPDGQLAELEKVVELRRQPLPEDPQLARLKRAVTLSESQLKQLRLTTAQDLAWALINSPAFLFNH
ncbi:DUF1549 domain-containing protein [Planctomicrobium sp. SH664]|uniref:DUF1549 domain-containing protein n=1 Tax=Planctomicrobium sp. SH664 TaxID=3448125 RepID=UPI003F5AE890